MFRLVSGRGGKISRKNNKENTMLPKSIYCFASIVLLFAFFGCEEEADDSTDNDVVLSAKPLPATAKVGRAREVVVAPAAELLPETAPIENEIRFPIESWDRGGYHDGGPWVTISYENKEDESTFITASRIAYAAKMVTTVWEEWEYPNLDAVREKVANFHIIAVHVPEGSTEPSDTLAHLRYPEVYEKDPNEALEKTGTLGAFCFPAGDSRLIDIPEKARFVIVLKYWFLTEGWMDTVVHEILHAVLLVAYGDADGSHKREDIWLRNSKEGLMAEVLDRLPY